MKKDFPFIAVFFWRAVFGIVLLSSIFSAAADIAAAQTETVSFGCPAWGFCEDFQETADRWAKKTGDTVKMYESGRLVDDSLGLFRQILSARSDEFDVILIDCIWPGMLAKHLVDLRQYVPQDEIDRHFKPIIDNYTDNYMDGEGRLIAMPLFTDAGVLYYRKDLLDKHGLSPPKTWAELKDIAERVTALEHEANPDLAGYVWQGKAYEGLTCNALEWINSHGGGTIIDEKSGAVTVNNPKAAAALKKAASWIGGISPEGVLRYTELEATAHFRAGNAVFMRNWVEPWATCDEPDSPVRGKVGIVALPKGGPDGKHAGTIGDMSLSVSRYSKHIEKSVDMVRFLADAPSQKRHAIEHSFCPTLISLYDDPELLAKRPFMAALKEVLVDGVSRPSKLTGEKYAKVSKKFSEAVHSVLIGEEAAEAALAGLERELNRIRGQGW